VRVLAGLPEMMCVCIDACLAGEFCRMNGESCQMAGKLFISVEEHRDGR
jgi:hypothetical protein